MASARLEHTGDLLLRADHEVHEYFRPHAGTLPIRFLDQFGKLGDQPELRIISGAMILAGALFGKARMTRAGVRMLIAHEAATAAKNAIKLRVDRTRPRNATERREKKPRKGKSKAKALTSFPSGHSAGAMAVARAFSREYPEYGAAALGVATVVAAGQVPRCAHYPTDVVAGVTIGLATEAAVDAVWRAADLP